MNEYMKSVLQDAEVLEELKSGALFKQAEKSIESLAPAARFTETPSESRFHESLERLAAGHGDGLSTPPAEAIIKRHGYPSLLVQNGTFESPKLEVWKQRLFPHREILNKAIASVGRVELAGYPHATWVGTGWLIDENTIVTNRHVAEIFAASLERQPDIMNGVDVSLDFAEEYERTRELVSHVSEIVHLEPEPGVDLAFLRLKKSATTTLKIEPIAISRELANDQLVAAIGYPAHDTRNNLADQSRIFRDIYNVKRLAPGRIKDASHSGSAFTHICLTLGGSSGSVVIDIESGCAVGLHFAGIESVENYAVRAQSVLDLASQSKIRATVKTGGFGNGDNGTDGGVGNGVGPERVPEDFSDREGFDPFFLGGRKLTTPLPRLNPLQQTQVAKTALGDAELKYTHFSVVMNKARRLAFYTAVNIDGSELWHKRRSKEPWRVDPRIEDADQIDNAIYRHNDFDRGHMVRRLDPIWGPDKAVASQAEMDTYFYTNAAPQHKDLNRKVWLELEDHILDRVDDGEAKVSVFTGPIFGDEDPRSRRQELEDFRFPLGFWKIIASIGKRKTSRSARKLETQGFVLWQKDMIDPSDLEIVFGDGLSKDVLQTPIADIERLTGLDFLNLKDADTLEVDDEISEETVTSRKVESKARDRWITIRSAEDIC